MHGVLRALILAALLANGAAMAQPGEASDPEVEASSAEAPAEVAPEVKLEGDVVHLQNGRVLSGVQVLRETPATIELQVHPDLDPLVLPRRQVTSIEYDRIDPNRRGGMPEADDEEKPGVLVAQQVPETLRPLLTKPFFGASGFTLTDRDFLLPLENQGRRAGIAIEITDAVRSIPEEQRQWSVELPPEAPFFSLLESFLKAHPDLQVDFTKEKVIIMTAEEFENREK